MKVIVFLMIILGLISCKSINKKEECFQKQETYSASLTYLKKHFETDEGNSIHNINEITKNINVLEDISGIKSEIGGDYVGKFRFTKNDVTKWEKWFKDNCDSNN